MARSQREPPAADGRGEAAWARLAAIVSRHAGELSAPPPGVPGLCRSCYGPVRPGHLRCFQCDYHRAVLPGLLPDIVVPIAYAPKGSPLARSLWIYKSGAPAGPPGVRGLAGERDAERARALLGALLATFLRSHWRCVTSAAGAMRPSHLAVVPSGRSRPGAHPLVAMAGSLLRLPQVELSLNDRDGVSARLVSPQRYRSPRLTGADVLLIDDTWTTGASCCSAAAALKAAGARSVAVVVIGRHIGRAGPGRRGAERARPAVRGGGAAADGAFSPRLMPFRAGTCAAHRLR
jgi:hypothetical protein